MLIFTHSFISLTKEYQNEVGQKVKTIFGVTSLLCVIVIVMIASTYIGRYNRGETKNKPKYEKVVETFYRKIK